MILKYDDVRAFGEIIETPPAGSLASKVDSVVLEPVLVPVPVPELPVSFAVPVVFSDPVASVFVPVSDASVVCDALSPVVVASSVADADSSVVAVFPCLPVKDKSNDD